jgi:alanine racemase
VIKPDIGIFTNIGEAHAEGFLNNRHKVKEKLKLFIHSRILIYCKDYHEITQAITEIRSQFTDDEAQEKFQLFTWAHKTDADLRITKIDSNSNETRIDGVYKEEQIHIVTPFIDKASIENSIHCWATMLYLRVHQEVIQARMRKLGKIAMRLELKDAVNNCSLINDSYNSDLGSLTIALDFLNQQKQHPKKTLILSDILQSGKNEMDLYEDVAALVGQKGVTRLLGIGPAISRQHKIFEKNVSLEASFYPSTDVFLTQLAKLHFADETILLKGARSFEFERISKLLEQKVHETVLEINLNALAHNLQVYHSLLKPGVKTMVMVKALSYGSGSFEIANTLQFHRADYLAVAYTDEAVTLRKGGITLPIMVMSPEQRSFEAIVQYQLEPDLYNEGVFNKFSEYLQLSGHANAEKPYPIHIELDTGMHRLGYGLDEIETLTKALKNTPWLKVMSIFSHLAASEDAVHDDFTSEQVGKFEQMSLAITKGLDYKPMRHILNSAGIARFPNAQYDMVRLGLGVYGIDTSEALAGKLQHVGRMRTTISQLRTIAAGETVSYSRTYTATNERRIATVGVGYADGIDRRLSNGVGSMKVHGRLAPIVGRVCMDMCMLDVTDVPEAMEGDEVIVFGPELPVQQIADWAGTIPYEILTGISSRVKRVYWQE